MTFVDWITAIGIPSIIIGLVYIGGRLHLLSSLDRTMVKLKANVKVIADFLIIRNDGFDHGRLQSYSPLKLTSNGEKFLHEVGFPLVFEEHSDEFFRCIDSEQPSTDYDIEAAAIRCVFFLFDQPYFHPIKDYLYQHPREEKTELIRVAGIYVRDKYMARKADQMHASAS